MRIDGWVLPDVPDGGGEPLRTDEVRTSPGGAIVRYPRLDPGAVQSLGRALRASRSRALAAAPAEEIADVLGGIGERFLDPDDPLRRRALEALPQTAGLSAPMAREVLDGMARDWTAERLRRLLRIDLGDPGVLDGFRPHPSGGSVRAVGPELGVHVCAGSVPGVSVTSLVRGLLVKSAVLLKPGREDVLLPVLFARALREERPDLAASVAVVYWPGGDSAIEGAALDAADTVVAYGGNETIESLRARVPVTTRFVAYHHRVGVALVGREALAPGQRARRTAERAARAVAIFDQRGCVSPHVIYVEDGGAMEGADWAEALARELEALEEDLPSGPLRPEEASRLQQLRGTAEMRRAAAEPVRIVHGGPKPWTVVVEGEPGFRPSCTGRVVRVRPVKRLDRAIGELAAVRRLLQTVSLDGAGSRRTELAEGLAVAGATRISTLDAVPWPPAWWHHDGTGPLRALLRWVDLERC